LVANILEYLEWRGDLPLSSVPFNEVDAAILARLSYLPLEAVLENQGGTKQSGKAKELTVAQAMEALAAADAEQLRFLWHEDPKLINALRASRRFAQLPIFSYSERLDIPSQTQFAAVSIRLAPALCYVSFRGTDDTLVGWQEDLNMGFVCPVPSQELAVEYLEALAKESTDEYITGGHSKGGNLAVYAAAFCTETVQKRVRTVYNFDGPGFVDRVLGAPGYLAVCDRVQTFVPQSSVVGMLLGHEEKHTIVHSEQKGILQHDLYSWQTKRASFVCLETVDKASRFIDSTLKAWMADMDTERRAQFVGTLYTVLAQTGALTLKDLTGNWFISAKAMLKGIKNLDEDTRRAVGQVLRLLLKSTRSGFAQLAEKGEA